MTSIGHRPTLIVIGSGVAGLYAALRAAHRAHVVVVTKAALEESNTRYAQGGIAVALGPTDSPELHLRDTIVAGDGLCDPAAVAVLTGAAPARIRDLIRLGVPFDREQGALAWAREGAHSRPRVLHVGGDATGRGIETVLTRLVRDAGVELLEHTAGVDLVVRDGCVTGVDLLPAAGPERRLSADAVLLATGGVGQLFARTTNPAVATGDGAAMAYRAGAELMDPEFVQFHPTAFALPGVSSFLISEAVRGEGGILRDGAGRAFMRDYHPDGELAPRDVVARAIHGEMERTGSPHVWLDVTHLTPALVERRFPGIVAFCRAAAVDPVRRPIPVAPAAHYWMGGIRTDLAGRTSLPGLFACGEVACTGAHGANRLASNSLLEGLVFAGCAVEAMLAGDREPHLARASRTGAPPVLPTHVPDRRTVATALWRDVALVRSAQWLARATEVVMAARARDLDRWQALEARNLGQLAAIVLAAAAAREESRGAHFRSDFPHSRPQWQAHTVVSRAGIGLAPLAASPVAAHA